MCFADGSDAKVEPVYPVKVPPLTSHDLSALGAEEMSESMDEANGVEIPASLGGRGAVGRDDIEGERTGAAVGFASKFSSGD